jgi:hypothetical protein
MYRSVRLKISSSVVWVGKGLHTNISSSTWLLYIYLTSARKRERPTMLVDSSACIVNPDCF